MSASVFKEKKPESVKVETVISEKMDPEVDSFNIGYEKGLYLGLEKKKSKSVTFKGDTKL